MTKGKRMPSKTVERPQPQREMLIKKLIVLMIAVAVGLAVLLSDLLAEGAEALRAWLRGEEIAWDRPRGYDNPAAADKDFPSARRAPRFN